MKTYKTTRGDEVCAYGGERFSVEVEGGGFDRTQLTELRHIIDQALNTSAEELGK